MGRWGILLCGVFALAATAAQAAVPSDQAGFMEYLAVRTHNAMPDWTFAVDGMNLLVTRGNSRKLTWSAQAAYDKCRQSNFDCVADMGTELQFMRARLYLPTPDRMRATLGFMADCSVIASVGNSISCRIKSAPGPGNTFFRRAFANLGVRCVKLAPNADPIDMDNADRDDLDLSKDAALDLCAKTTHDVLGPLAARLKPLSAGEIGEIDAPFAASYALYPDDWSAFAAQSGGHFLIAMPLRNVLLYIAGDGPAEQAALSRRLIEVGNAGSGIGVSIDVYRWTGDGFYLGTEKSAMGNGPPIVTDAMPRAPQ